MKWKITCKEATDFISKKEEGKLSLMQRIQLMLHFGICSFCKLFYRQTKIIANQSAHLHEHSVAQLSQAEKESIINKINAE